MNQGTKLVLLMKKNRSQKSCASVPLSNATKVGVATVFRLSINLCFNAKNINKRHN
jgi:hypothetical protein